MNSRTLKKFILPLLVIIVLFLVFTPGGSSGGGSSVGAPPPPSLPLGLGQPLKFTNISRFGESGDKYQTIKTYSNGRPVNIKNNLSIKSTKPSGDPYTSNELIEYVIFGTFFMDYVNNVYGNPGPPESIKNVLSTTTFTDTQDAIKKLNNTDKIALSYAVLGIVLCWGENLKKEILYCLDNLTTEDCNGANVCVWCINTLLNTDLLNNIPKVGAGWDEYTIESANVTQDTDLVITPSVNTSSKNIKLMVLKYRGKEKDSTTSNLYISLGGKDNNGQSLETYTNRTSFYDDPGDFHNSIYCLPLEYPVTIDSVSITLTCPGTSAEINDAVILFVYQ